MSRCAAAVGGVLLLLSACSKEGSTSEGQGGGGGAAGTVTAGRGGAGGVGGSVTTGVAGAAGTGGAPSMCPLPQSGGGSSGAACACTYAAQKEHGGCFAWGDGVISTGTCGAFRAWHCNGGLYVQTCLYDQNENLVGQRYCGDTPQPCAAAGVQLGAQETCALKDVLMPETGCASAGSDGGVDCCGDGHLSPAGPPFNCAAREDERAGPYCRYVGSCGQVVSIYGFSSVRSCYYDAAGTLIYATRSEQRTTQGPYCGQVQITSAWLGSGDASQVSSCGTSASRTSCLPSTDAGTD